MCFIKAIGLKKILNKFIIRTRTSWNSIFHVKLINSTDSNSIDDVASAFISMHQNALKNLPKSGNFMENSNNIGLYLVNSEK